MSVITLVPSDNTAVIDGEVAVGVDFSGIDPTIHAVTWVNTQGYIQYVSDPITGAGLPNEIISSLTPFQSYVTQAQNIIYAQNNPVTCYSTIDDLIYQGNTYGLGQDIIVTSVGWPRPPQSTDLVPPIPEDYQKLYWYNDAWVASAFDPNSTLSQAKTILTLKVQGSGAAACDEQARIYSMLQLVTDAQPGNLNCADYFSVTLADYQTYIDAEIASMVAQVNAATTTSGLYNFNPIVDSDPNP